MCLIIASPDGASVSKREMRAAWANNPDGFGVAWAADGALHVERTLVKGEVKGLLRRAEGKPYIAHWRYATHGECSLDNVHPFKVHDGLVMAHNGIIQLPQENMKRSDTWHFVQILAECVKGSVSQGLANNLAELVGRGNKLAFLDAMGTVTLVNGSEGAWRGKRWVSNLYSLEMPTYTCWRDDEEDEGKPYGDGAWWRAWHRDAPPNVCSLCGDDVREDDVETGLCDYCFGVVGA